MGVSHDMLMKRLLDGQFEESLCKGLIALYYSGIKYPEPLRKAS